MLKEVSWKDCEGFQMSYLLKGTEHCTWTFLAVERVRFYYVAEGVRNCSQL